MPDQSFALAIPRKDNTDLEITLGPGECLFVLGANGTGKSALLHRLYAAHREVARRITAHRQAWWASNALTMSPEEKRNMDANIQNTDTSEESRWKDPYPNQRASIAIFDLIDAENVRSRAIAGAVDEEDIARAQSLSQNKAPLKIIDELLRLSNIPISLSVVENDQILAVRPGVTPYSVAELSDGERNAILIAARVLTAKPGTLILIDEPERHLHRAIITPLLTNLFQKRADCTFVISTHETMLPIDNPDAKTLLLRATHHDGTKFVSWEADMLSAGAQIDDELRRDILGARRKVLFVEGNDGSLDKPMYTALFPTVSVVAKSGAREVERAVTGIRSVTDLHWIGAYGIVDNDRRTEEELQRLHSKGIHATEVFAVESLYYGLDVQAMLANRMATSDTSMNASQRLEDAKQAALRIVASETRRLSERAVLRQLRQEVMKQLPNSDSIAAGRPIAISFEVSKYVDEEETRLKEKVNTGDLEGILGKYPIHETSALSEMARRLGYRSAKDYEAAVRKLITDDPSARDAMRKMFGALVQEGGL